MAKNFNVLPILFINDNGRLRFWRVHTSNKPMTDNFVVKRWGLWNGAQQTKETLATPKNIGRSNATNSFQQANIEAKALWNAKKDEGYKSLEDLGITIHVATDTRFDSELGENVQLRTENIYRWYQNADNHWACTRDNLPKKLMELLPVHKTDAQGIVKAMTLHKFRLPEFKKGTKEYKTSRDILYPCYGQYKEDGVCTIYTRGIGLTTRGGKDRHTRGGQSLNEIVPHVYKALNMLQYPLPLNGELVVPNRTLQEVTSAVKKANGLSKHMEFHIFDVINTKEIMKDRIKRLNTINEMVKSLGIDDIVKVIESVKINDFAELMNLERIALLNNKEGIVVRNLQGKYTPGKRSKDVLKLVRMDSSEVEIIDIQPMTNEPTHGMFVCVINTGTKDNLQIRKFKVTPSEFSHKERVDLLTNKQDYIGKMLTITHRGYTDDGIPRIAKAVAIRDYE